jgi:hypothetical protein
MSFQKGSILEQLHNYDGLLDSNTAGGENGLITVHVDAQEGLLG